MRPSDSTTLDQPSPKPEGPLPTQHMAATTPIAEAVEVEERFLNRELSWLDFNARVLELAADPTVPLFERMRFCSIFASNLDEFFMVRVAGLARQAASSSAARSADGRTPTQTLAEVRDRIVDLCARQSVLWSLVLQPELAEHAILIDEAAAADESELAELRHRFEAEVNPLLTPFAVGPGQPFPHLSGLTLNIALLVRDPESGHVRFARVEVPESLPRFLTVGSRGLHIPLESVISHFLPDLFPQMDILERAIFRVTRDADFELSDEADDLLEAVEDELRRRRFRDVIRLEVSASASRSLLAHLVDCLGVADHEIYRVAGPLALAHLSQFVAADRPELKDTPWESTTPARLAEGIGADDFFAAIRSRDILVHHPYDSFVATFERFVGEGVRDESVLALKTTVYRTSEDSPLVPALIEVAESGRQSVCLVELKARFDERRNLEWSRALRAAGVNVGYGFPDLKIHAKTTLLVRREGDELRRYVHVGTGNYHALTARSYEDLGVFTADEEIAADVADFFNFLTGFGRPQGFRKILVAPFNLRERLVDEIQAVARAASAGETARIRLKTNALTDDEIVEELYRASQAGAKIDIVARSICTLRPGVKWLSEGVRVRSVLGRFLEHSRLFRFDAGERSTTYLGSADLMPRNLDRRIEIVVPVEDARAQEKLNFVFDVLLADDTGWDLGPDGRWTRAEGWKDQRSRQSHRVLMREASLRNGRHTSGGRARLLRSTRADRAMATGG
jgi:polyphosphate kinase